MPHSAPAETSGPSSSPRPPQAAAGILSIREKVGYAVGDTACNLFWKTFEFFLLFFYTEVFGLTAVQAGTMFLITRIWDAINDPLMGLLADRTRSRWGKFRPYLLWMALPMAAAGVLTFTTPNLEGGAKLAYAYGTYILMMMAYTAVNIPYSALMGVLTPHSEERTSLSSFRFIGAFTGAVFVQWSTLRLVARLGGGNDALGWQLTLAVYGVIASLLLAFSFFSTKERVEPPASQVPNLKEDVRDLLGNGAWRIMFVLGVFVIVNFSLRGSAAAYYFKYFIGDQSLWGAQGSDEIFALFLTTGGFANILGVACTKPLNRMMSKRRLYMLLMSVGGLLAVPMYWLPPEAVGVVLVLNVVANFVMGPTAPLLFAMYADTADYAEWKTGRRSTGLVFSGAMFAMKLGGALGGFLAGAGLSWFGYVANQPQTPQAIHGLVTLMSLVPGVMGLMAAGLVVWYKLDDDMMGRIEADLSRRRQAEEDAKSGRSEATAPEPVLEHA